MLENNYITQGGANVINLETPVETDKLETDSSVVEDEDPISKGEKSTPRYNY